MQVKVTAKSVYGATAYYPANDTARAMARIARTKTLTYDVLCTLRDAGFTVVVEPVAVPISYEL